MPSASKTPRASASALPRRWVHKLPAQRRGHQTAEAFAGATEDLLRTHPFEDITIRDIVHRARRPIGSFYALFASKEALLPFLYQRYHEGLEPLLVARLARVDWESLDFDSAIAATVDFMLEQYDERRWLIRALALFSRQRPEALPADLVERRRRVYDHVVRVLIRHRDGSPHDDFEAAIRFGVYAVSAIAREKLLFRDAPLSRITPMSRQVLRDELVRMLGSYLGGRTRR
jgi:AcrR family transcriptional regulator